METPELFDTHCHLNTRDLRDDADEAWARAQEAGVRNAVVIGIDVENATDGVQFAREREGLWAAVGIHPCHVHEAAPGDFDRVRELSREEGVVAIGESGLDLYHDPSTLPIQQEMLRAHADLALEVDKPLVLHVREAFPALREGLEPYKDSGLKAILHCFGGEPEDLDPWVERGFHVSIAGIVTYKKAENVRAAARLVPDDQLLVETDAPWLAPAPHRGKRNEPAYVAHTARRLAEVREMSFEDLARLTTANARRLFGLPAAS